MTTTARPTSTLALALTGSVALGITFQVGHFIEHTVQMGVFVFGSHTTPYMSPVATYLTHLLRNFCKRKTEVLRRRFPKSPNHVRILQIQRPFPFLPSPFHDKLVMIQPPRRDGQA